MPDSRSDIDRLWADYKAKAGGDDRDRLILHYSPLVKYVAGRVAVGLPQSVEQSDLVSYGIFGLIDAIEKFDPARGYKFETYAISRIKGAIIDELRSIDWVPRSVRAKARAHRAGLQQARGPAAPHAVGRRAGQRAGPHRRPAPGDPQPDQLRRPRRPRRDALLAATGASGMTLGDTVPSNPDEAPGVAFEIEETPQALADAIGRMPEREKVVLSLYYYEGLTLAEIGSVLGVTESRVCQIHTKAVLQLRSRIAAADREMA